MAAILSYLCAVLLSCGEPGVLVGQLGSRHFHARQRASVKLAAMPPWRLVPLLERHLLASSGPEVVYRCQQLLDGMYADCGPTAGEIPMIYCLAGPVAGDGQYQDFANWQQRCFQPNVVPALVAHVYFARQLRIERLGQVRWNVPIESNATWLLLRDLRGLGVPAADCRKLCDWMQLRASFHPLTPMPGWMAAWATANIETIGAPMGAPE